MDAEIVRDIFLASSGLLSTQVGGDNAFPPAPSFLFQPPTSYGPKVWNESTGSEKYRRAIYTFRFRSVPYPILQTFDAPNGESSCVRRSRSNTPLQALATLNEPLFLESAQALAAKAIENGGVTDEQRIRYVVRRVLSRPPTAPEQTELLALLAREQSRFAATGLDPAKFAGIALAKGGDPVKAAAWTAVARVVLNLDEAITKE